MLLCGSQVSHWLRHLRIWPSEDFPLSMEKLTGRRLCTTEPGCDLVALSENGRPGVSAYCKGYFSASLERSQIADFFCSLVFHSLPNSPPQRTRLLLKIGGRPAWAEKWLPVGRRVSKPRRWHQSLPPFYGFRYCLRKVWEKGNSPQKLSLQK